MKRALIYSMLSVSILAGCAADMARKEAESLIVQGDPESGLRVLKDKIASYPEDIPLRTAYASQLNNYLARLQAEGDAARLAGNTAVAISKYQLILSWDPNNTRARESVRMIELGVRHNSMLAYANSVKDTQPKEALGIAQQILKDDPGNKQARTLYYYAEGKLSKQALKPTLAANLQSPISLQFRDQPLMSVFEIISRAANVNFIFDKDVPPNLKATIFARNTTVEDVINLLLTTNQLDRKILNENTILIFPKRPDKDRDYKDLTMRTFYLNNADPKQVLAMIKQMIKTRDVYIDERLNMLVMRDTPEAIAVAERLIAAQDLPMPEVELDVQILEVNSSDVLNLGIEYPGSVSATVFDPNYGTSGPIKDLLAAGKVMLNHINNINSSDVLVNLGSPTVTANLQQVSNNGNILANPKIRVKNKDKAKVVIGERVPVVTTTNSNGVVTENINYQDIGLTLNVEPALSQDTDVSVKLSLEVSNITKQIVTKSGLVAYQIGTRRAETNMSVRDGETQVLAGLLNKVDKNDGSGLPFLSSIPLLDRIAGTKKTQNDRTEIVMLITPRLVKTLNPPPSHIMEFESGTEGGINTDALRLRSASTISISSQGGQSNYVPPAPPPAPAPVQAATPAPATQSIPANAEPQHPAPTPTPENKGYGGGMGRR
ncbi:secretin N-terminal domain-containing protein [Chitinilyticum piscinae]|uniref:Secretin and TonB N-terminal domain-containing protein n=1 Tax=Chitinilyticum piscinae TaxID=2866724 RepID=A0A8J7G2Z2_9NEIS|nr:secretin N-terminal domain-containing protein [Chitinilyticum piscinae]MBE9610403.1 secretin and TonB N-terminal domain-containing protein [Chitinilyticum piscinae]